MSAVQQQMIVLATACDESGKTTGLFIVSAPSPLKQIGEPAGSDDQEMQDMMHDLFQDCFDTTTTTTTTMATITKSENEKKAPRGILKPAKAISLEALAALPPPIQRSARLSPRELRRLTPNLLSPPPSQTATFTTKPATTKVHFTPTMVTRVHDAHSTDEYNRGACEFAARSLTPQLALLIKRELNEVKREMEVHEESREHTQFYKI